VVCHLPFPILHARVIWKVEPSRQGVNRGTCRVSPEVLGMDMPLFQPVLRANLGRPGGFDTGWLGAIPEVLGRTCAALGAGWSLSSGRRSRAIALAARCVRTLGSGHCISRLPARA
jgi:hypothetical protein